MSNDSLGPDSPLGDSTESKDTAASEDFLGLQADSLSVDGPSSEVIFDGSQGDPDGAESMESNGGEVAAQALAAIPEEDQDPSGVAEDFLGLEVSGEPGVEGDEEMEGASWLMEFDSAQDDDEEQEEAFASAFEDDEEEGEADEGELEEVGAGRSPWLGRSLLAVISVALGVVGSKFIPGIRSGGETGDGTEVAQVNKAPVVQRPAAQPANKGTKAPEGKGATGLGQGTDVKVAANTSPPSTPPKAPTSAAQVPADPVQKTDPGEPKGHPQGPEHEAQQGPELVIDVGETTPVIALPVAEPVAEPDPALAVENDGKLREATSYELAGIWTKRSIPHDAVGGARRILTPGVGDVRVLLHQGEVFEGRLYAVGNRQVWLETGLGRMALPEWQVDSIASIEEARGAGSASMAMTAGLQSVRVRTVGGVFYGKLVSQEGDTVILLTDSGGRLTLANAELAGTGRTASHVVDASGVIDDGVDAPSAK